MTACDPSAALIAWPRDGGPLRVRVGTTAEVTAWAAQARARPDLYARIGMAGFWDVTGLATPPERNAAEGDAVP